MSMKTGHPIEINASLLHHEPKDVVFPLKVIKIKQIQSQSEHVNIWVDQANEGLLLSVYSMRLVFLYFCMFVFYLGLF